MKWNFTHLVGKSGTENCSTPCFSLVKQSWTSPGVSLGNTNATRDKLYFGVRYKSTALAHYHETNDSIKSSYSTTKHDVPFIFVCLICMIAVD